MRRRCRLDGEGKVRLRAARMRGGLLESSAAADHLQGCLTAEESRATR